MVKKSKGMICNTCNKIKPEDQFHDSISYQRLSDGTIKKYVYKRNQCKECRLWQDKLRKWNKVDINNLNQNVA